MFGAAVSHGMNIVGSLSNFDCWNDDYDDAEGFEIEIEDFSSSDITGTYAGSAFGGPTLINTGHSVKVRYYNPSVHLPRRAVTHFGVHSNRVIPAASIKYRWIHQNNFGSGTYTVEKKLPKHDVAMITLDDGSQALRDVIVNTEPDNGTIFFILPYRIDVPGAVSLETLMSNNGTINGATPMGQGPNDLDPEELDPGNSWGNDDAAVVEPGAQEESKIFWYKIYANGGTADNPVPGELVGIMMDNTVIAAGQTQTITGNVHLQSMSSAAGLPVQVEFYAPGGTNPLQTYLQTLGSTDNLEFHPGAYLTPGSYEVRIFGETWLADRQPVTIGTTGVTLPTYNLLNGDVTGDNLVDISDYTELAFAFDSVTGSTNYSKFVDLNRDGVVDIADYTILATNFDKVGDD